MPAVLDGLIREHLQHRGNSLYASRDTGWLFPGGNPGRHLATENIRAQLAGIGIRPYDGRKATLFQLAAYTPPPVVDELIGITYDNAADWARLAAPRPGQLHRRTSPLTRAARGILHKRQLGTLPGHSYVSAKRVRILAPESL
jgi:hypothetical protein